MIEKPAEASRIRPPGWRDPRLIVGVILVVLSVAGVVALIQAADSRQGYWAASVDVVPGAQANAEDFHIVQASMSESSDQYWLADEELPPQFLVSSTIRQGELLPKFDVAESDPDGRQQVGVRVSQDMPASVDVGSRADVWVALASTDGRGFEEPTKMINNAEVVGMDDNTSAFAAADTTTVHLMLSDEALPSVLDAQANGAQISLVPTTVEN
ncbi:flagellar protein FlgA [Yaniella flava]|uniref:Flagellar protein FlgA n=1 Tax=Yaniella flava TaxID=287930 RepID=A0ABN2U7Q0_9MICC|nr:flagellar biosynthesis protein FlgA [Micrococcaceae bacterium]